MPTGDKYGSFYFRAFSFSLCCVVSTQLYPLSSVITPPAQMNADGYPDLH